jgi:predicted SAM-dependent methyltransferase
MIKLHLGCGRNTIGGWINTDFDTRKHPDVKNHLDVTDKFSIREKGKDDIIIDDNSVDYIFSEHMIEHLTYQEGKFMLEECFRVLKVGGKIRISTPDLKFLIDLYTDDKTDLQKRYIDYTVNHRAYNVSIGIDTFIINNYVRDWGHIFIYDEKTLKSLFESVGFSDVKSYLISESEDENLKNLENINDSENRGQGQTKEFLQLETFTLEATK